MFYENEKAYFRLSEDLNVLEIQVNDLPHARTTAIIICLFTGGVLRRSTEEKVCSPIYMECEKTEDCCPGYLICHPSKSHFRVFFICYWQKLFIITYI